MHEWMDRIDPSEYDMGEVGLSYALGRVHFHIECNHRTYNKKYNITCQLSHVRTTHKDTGIHTHIYIYIYIYIYMHCESTVKVRTRA